MEACARVLMGDIVGSLWRPTLPPRSRLHDTFFLVRPPSEWKLSARRASAASSTTSSISGESGRGGYGAHEGASGVVVDEVLSETFAGEAESAPASYKKVNDERTGQQTLLFALPPFL